jgi:hypothetical protein
MCDAPQGPNAHLAGGNVRISAENRGFLAANCGKYARPLGSAQNSLDFARPKCFAGRHFRRYSWT